MVLLKQLLIFLFMMVLGYGMAKKGIMEEKACSAINWLLVNIANPALVISSSIGNAIEKEELLFTLLLAAGLYLVVLLLAWLVIPLFHASKKEAGVYKCLIVFGNIGFMGFPMISAVYGAQALIYGAGFLILYNVLIYSYGEIVMAGKRVSVINALKKCCNIGTLSALIAFVLAYFQWQLPDAVNQGITMLGDLTGPLCMMVIGASFIDVTPKELFLDWKLFAVSAIRLLVIPLAAMPVIRLVTSNVTMQAVCFVMLATPSGTMVSMMAQECGGEYMTASKGVTLTMVLSILTMPLLFALLRM